MNISEQADYLAKMACIVEDNIDRLEKCALDPSTLAALGAAGGAGLGAIANTVLANRRAKKNKTPVGSNLSHALLGGLTGGLAGGGLGYLGGMWSKGWPVGKTPTEKRESAIQGVESQLRDSRLPPLSDIGKLFTEPAKGVSALASIPRRLVTGKVLEDAIGSLGFGVPDVLNNPFIQLGVGGTAMHGAANWYAKKKSIEELSNLFRADGADTIKKIVGESVEPEGIKQRIIDFFGRAKHKRAIDAATSIFVNKHSTDDAVDVEKLRQALIGDSYNPKPKPGGKVTPHGSAEPIGYGPRMSSTPYVGARDPGTVMPSVVRDVLIAHTGHPLSDSALHSLASNSSPRWLNQHYLDRANVPLNKERLTGITREVLNRPYKSRYRRGLLGAGVIGYGLPALTAYFQGTPEIPQAK